MIPKELLLVDLPYTRIVRPSGVTALLAAGATSGAIQVPWPANGWCTGISVATQEATAAALSALSIRVQARGGTQDLFSDGQAAAFAHAGSQIASNGVSLATLFKIRQPAKRSDFWNLTIKNESGAVAATPIVQFYLYSEEDLNA